MDTKPQDARHVPLSKVDKLRQNAEEASLIRALSTHPDVVALRVERFRSAVDMMIWAGLVLGLAFTMVNVQQFVAADAPVGSLAWLSAWVFDPMISLVLIAVLLAEQVTARYQVDTGKWARRTKVFAFVATYLMNTWESWAVVDVAGIVKHSFPPVLVYLVAETAPTLRDRLTEAVARAAFVDKANDTTAATTVMDTTVSTQDSSATVDTPPVPPVERRTPRSRKPATRKVSKPRRPSREEYLSRARAAHRPGIVPEPAWVREVVPDISRGTSKVVADLLKAELAATTPHITPNTTTETTDENTVDQGRAA